MDATEVGELDIRTVLPLSGEQRERLARLAAKDGKARALLAARRDAARRLLAPDARPPRPLAVIRYEGLVNTDPRRVADVENLRDMDDAALLLEVWQATRDKDAARRGREYVRAWADAYRPTGNDVNENKLVPLFTLYEALRADFSAAERTRIEAWMADIAARQIEEGREPEARRSNRHTKRLGIVALVGLALGRREWLDHAWDGCKEFIGANLYPDGASFDLRQRDTLTYHNSALRPLLTLAILAKRDGNEDLYRWRSPSGSSLKASVDYVAPYAKGEKRRREWENSQVELDRRRGGAGALPAGPPVRAARGAAAAGGGVLLRRLAAAAGRAAGGGAGERARRPLPDLAHGPQRRVRVGVAFSVSPVSPVRAESGTASAGTSKAPGGGVSL